MRVAWKSLLFAAVLSCSWLGCKSGDDDDAMGDEPTTSGPGSPQAGKGDAGGGAAGNAGEAGEQGGKAGSTSENEGGEGGTDGSAGQDASRAGDDAPPPDGGDPNVPLPKTPLSELPQVFADAICAALDDCLGESKLRELTRREACGKTVAAELRAKDFAHMDSAISAGTVLYDPENLGACVDGIRELGCEVLSHTFPAPCVDVLDGNVAIEGECTITAECEGDAFCAGTDACPSKCSALLAADASCSGDGQCANGLGCYGGKCTAASRAGEECGGTTGKVCALGLNCRGATDTEIGSCVSNDEIQVGSAGDACEPGGALCKDGLSCVFAGGSAFHCEAAVASGAACHLGLPGQCPNDEYCDSTELTAASSCRKLPGADQPCVLNGLCKGGLVCLEDGGSHVCRAIADNGGDCADDSACRSGRCVADKCEPPPSCE